jgi:hypothetical protein
MAKLHAIDYLAQPARYPPKPVCRLSRRRHIISTKVFPKEPLIENK